MKELLIATRSKGKIPEIVAVLSEAGFACVGLNDVADLPVDYEVEEPAMTFEGNAIIKAMTFGRITGMLTMAEDSGLSVDALGGRPGVYSKRYADGTDEDRYKKLLTELVDVPEKERTARFVTVVAIYDPATDKIRTCEGKYEGLISTEPVGDNGFGYDPVFYSPELQKTNAQLSLEEKNRVSHRGQALQKAKQILLEDFQ